MIFPKYGFLMFNNSVFEKKSIKANKMGGLYALGGEVHAFEFVKDLPAGVTWWSNLEKPEVWRTGKGYIKNKHFLGISYEAISTLLFSGESREDQAKVLAKVFERTMFVYEDFLRKSEKPFSLKEELFEHIYEDFFLGRTGKETTDSDRLRLKEAYIEKITLPQNEKQHKKHVSFFFDSHSYFKDIAAEQVPHGVWHENENLAKLDFDSARTFVLSKKNQGNKLLVNIDHLKLLQPLNQIPVGAIWQGERGYQLNGAVIEDLWLTEKEFEFINEFAKFDVLKAMWNEKSFTASEFFNKLEDRLVEGIELRRLTLPYQCLMKSFVRAYMTAVYETKKRTKYPFTESMIWWRTRDRERCLGLALDLIKEGFVVSEYGDGEIRLEVTSEIKEKKELLVEILLRHNIVVPFGIMDVDVPSADTYNCKDWELKKRIGKKLYFFLDMLTYQFLRTEKTDNNRLLKELESFKFTQEEEKGRFKWFLTKVKETVTSQTKA